jgi:hypothetical protein
LFKRIGGRSSFAINFISRFDPSEQIRDKSAEAKDHRREIVMIATAAT